MKLYLFDLDGTLISSYMDEPDRNYDTWRVLPDRVAYLRHIQNLGHKIGIVTNQGAVAFGYVSEEQARAKIAAAIAALDSPADTPVYVCFADARSKDARYCDPAQVVRRKPSGAMIREAMADAGATAEETIYIGDRPEDAQAAADAGVRFVDADEFFGRPVRWQIVGNSAVRPSDGALFNVERTRTTIGYNLYSDLGGDVQAIHAVAERLQVRIVEAYGDLDDERPWGMIETSLDGAAWAREAPSSADDEMAGRYILSRTR